MRCSNEHALQNYRTRLAFLHAKLQFRLYAEPAVIPQKISYNLSLHEVFDLLIQNGEKVLFGSILRVIANLSKRQQKEKLWQK